MEDNPNLYLILGRVEGKLDGLMARSDSIDKRLDDQDDRITGIETLVHQKQGRMAVYSLGGATLLTLVGLAGFFLDHFKELIL